MSVARKIKSNGEEDNKGDEGYLTLTISIKGSKDDEDENKSGTA